MSDLLKSLSDDELMSRIVNCDRNIKRLVSQAKEKKESITVQTQEFMYNHVLTSGSYPSEITLENAVMLIEDKGKSLNRFRKIIRHKELCTAPNFMNAIFHYNARERYIGELARRDA